MTLDDVTGASKRWELARAAAVGQKGHEKEPHLR
jgi:hypothetical protein